MDDLKNRSRVYIHRYSRVSYFWTVIRLLTGETSPQIPEETLNLLRAGIDGPVTVEKILVKLRKEGISKKYRRHRWSLCRMLGGGREFEFPPDTILKMLKMFRIIEFYWNHHKKEVWGNRITFFSYPYLIYEFLLELGHTPPEGLLLKSITLQKKQKDAYWKLKNIIKKLMT